MNFEDLQKTWQEMSLELEKQKKLTHEIVMQMTQQRYKNQLQKIANYEGIGAILCFIIALFVLANINKLDTWYLLACGIFAIAFLLLYPFLSLGTIRAMRRINVIEGNYTETLKTFTKARNNFLIVQRIGIAFGFVLGFTMLPVGAKILRDKDIFQFFQESAIGIWSIPLFIVFMILISSWGYGHYKRITKSAGKIISELEEY